MLKDDVIHVALRGDEIADPLRGTLAAAIAVFNTFNINPEENLEKP